MYAFWVGTADVYFRFLLLVRLKVISAEYAIINLHTFGELKDLTNRCFME